MQLFSVNSLTGIASGVGGVRTDRGLNAEWHVCGPVLAVPIGAYTRQNASAACVERGVRTRPGAVWNAVVVRVLTACTVKLGQRGLAVGSSAGCQVGPARFADGQPAPRRSARFVP